MQLIYRAQAFNYQPQETASYHQPRALNWRYQQAGETYRGVSEKPVYRQPHALNWRYCINP